MGLVAFLKSFVRTERHGSKVSDAVVDIGGGVLLTCEHFDSLGADSHPLPGDYAIITRVPGSGRAQVVGYLDPKNLQLAKAGEHRTYSRNGSGEQVAQVWQKEDGSIEISNDKGKYILESGGDVVINGVRIDTGGNISGAANIDHGGDLSTGGSNTTAGTLEAAGITDTVPGVTLGTHTHGFPTPVTPAPTPGS